MWITRFTVAAAAILALSGCVVAPAPYYSSYPTYGYGYGYGNPGYYGPAYVAGPTLAIGIGGGRGHWR
jgi:hypothetical protein